MEKIKIADNGQWSLLHKSAKPFDHSHSKYNKQKEIRGRWIHHGSAEINDGYKPQRDRDKIRFASDEERDHSLNSIKERTSTRINPDTKEREFLLHRGLNTNGPDPKKLWEKQHDEKTGHINFKSNTSWTPDFRTAKASSNGHTISHWVPEKHIKADLTTYPSKSPAINTWEGRWFKEGDDPKYYEPSKLTSHIEDEIVVGPMKFTPHAINKT